MHTLHRNPETRAALPYDQSLDDIKSYRRTCACGGNCMRHELRRGREAGDGILDGTYCNVANGCPIHIKCYTITSVLPHRRHRPWRVLTAWCRTGHPSPPFPRHPVQELTMVALGIGCRSAVALEALRQYPTSHQQSKVHSCIRPYTACSMEHDRVW